MYTVSARTHYDAAHFLRNYKGKCENLHGHRYVVEATVRTERLNESGIAFDFVELKRHLREIAGRLDHRLINELPPFDVWETSAENQARYFYEELQKLLPPDIAGGLVHTRVWETPDQCAQYEP
ncbi:MAG: 6-carboxytetrahydropterin synthase QueD [Gemmatimonadota bacterium]